MNLTAGAPSPATPLSAGSRPPELTPAFAAPGPLLLWLLIQLAALLLATLRVPLAASGPEPADLYALHIVVIVQIATAAALFPALMRDWVTTTMVICSTWPFQLAGGYLAALAPSRIASVAAYVATWLLALAIVGRALKGNRSRLLASSIVLSYVLGDVLLRYVRVEFATGNGWSWLGSWPAASPIAIALQWIDQGCNEAELTVAGVTLIVAALLAIALRRRRSDGNPVRSPHR